MSQESSPVLAICGSFSFDSVLSIEGRPVVGKVGGNALWSTLGALMSGRAPRVLAIVGSDYPRHVLEVLAAAGIDTGSIVEIERSHPVRITFAHLPDGGRLQPVPAELLVHLDDEHRAMFVDTSTDPAVLPLGAPQGSQVPDAWLTEVDAWHLPLLPLTRHRSLVERLATARGTLQTDCPARSDLLGDPFARLAPTLGGIDIFLPSTSDFDVIAAGRSLDEVAQELREAGAGTLVVKAGADGSMVIDGDDIWHVPAYPDVPVDPTGAGDTFCGGFLVGRAETGDLVHAAALGSAAASFALATENPLDLIAVDPEEVRARARAILAGVSKREHASLGGAA